MLEMKILFTDLKAKLAITTTTTTSTSTATKKAKTAATTTNKQTQRVFEKTFVKIFNTHTHTHTHTQASTFVMPSLSYFFVAGQIYILEAFVSIIETNFMRTLTRPRPNLTKFTNL